MAGGGVACSAGTGAAASGIAGRAGEWASEWAGCGPPSRELGTGARAPLPLESRAAIAGGDALGRLCGPGVSTVPPGQSPGCGTDATALCSGPICNCGGGGTFCRVCRNCVVGSGGGGGGDSSCAGAAAATAAGPAAPLLEGAVRTRPSAAPCTIATVELPVAAPAEVLAAVVVPVPAAPRPPRTVVRTRAGSLAVGSQPATSCCSPRVRF